MLLRFVLHESYNATQRTRKDTAILRFRWPMSAPAALRNTFPWPNPSEPLHARLHRRRSLPPQLRTTTRYSQAGPRYSVTPRARCVERCLSSGPSSVWKIGSFLSCLTYQPGTYAGGKVAENPANLGFCEVLLLMFFHEAVDWPALRLLEL